MIGVQLIGRNAVLQRYAKFDAGSWALYQGKQFIVGGDTADDLGEWIEDFARAGSTATYTLRVYEGEGAPSAAAANTDYIACLHFKAIDMYEGYGIAGHGSKVMERLEAIEKRMSGPDEDPGEDINSIIMGWLNSPEKLGMVVGAFRQLIGMDGPVPAAIASPAAPQPIKTIGSMNEPNPVVQEEMLNRLSAALDTLEKHDPKLVQHIEKLASLAKRDQVTFNFILAKLDAL